MVNGISRTLFGAAAVSALIAGAACSFLLGRAAQTGQFDGRSYTNVELAFRLADPGAEWILNENYKTTTVEDAAGTHLLQMNHPHAAGKPPTYPLFQIDVLRAGGPDAEARAQLARGEVPSVMRGPFFGKNASGVAFQVMCESSSCRASFYTSKARVRIDFGVHKEFTRGGTEIDEAATKEMRRILQLVTELP